MPTVSTIIPVYNGSDFIAEAVASAVEQREVDAEVIVIDDGSTDDTWQILEQFGNSIRKVQQKNAGHVAARNAGVEMAEGEWVAFLDADDVWLPDKLSKQLQAADTQSDLVYTDRLNFGDCPHVVERQSDEQDLREGDIFEPLLLTNFITVSSVMMRKKSYQRLGGFDPKPYGCEDWDLWLRYTTEGGLVRVCREPLTRYRWRADSMTTNLNRMLSGRLLVVRRALASSRGRQLPRTVAARARANVWQTSAWYAAIYGDPKALLWYLRAICHWPFDANSYRELLKCCLGLIKQES